jgi:hypothetical protein
MLQTYLFVGNSQALLNRCSSHQGNFRSPDLPMRHLLQRPFFVLHHSPALTKSPSKNCSTTEQSFSSTDILFSQWQILEHSPSPGQPLCSNQLTSQKVFSSRPYCHNPDLFFQFFWLWKVVPGQKMYQKPAWSSKKSKFQGAHTRQTRHWVVTRQMAVWMLQIMSSHSEPNSVYYVGLSNIPRIFHFFLKKL